MFFSPKAWFVIVGVCFALLGLLVNAETGLTGISYFSSDDAQIRSNLAQRSAQHAALELSQSPAMADGRPDIAVAPVVDDYQGLVTGQLKTWIGRRNVRVTNSSRFYSLGGFFTQRPSTIEEAIAPFLDGAADYIIAADVDNWTTYPEYQAKLVGSVYLFNREGELLAQLPLSPENVATYTGGMEVASSAEQASKRTDKMPQASTEHSKALLASDTNSTTVVRSYRLPVNSPEPQQASLFSSLVPTTQMGIVAWFGVVLLGPWGFQQPIKRVLYRRDNRANAQMLVLWGAFCAVGLWLIMTWGGLSVITTSVAVIAGVLAAWYFALVCEKLEKTL